MPCVHQPHLAPNLAIYGHSVFPSLCRYPSSIHLFSGDCALSCFSLCFAKNVPFRITRLRTLLYRHFEQVISFLFVPHSLQKIPGWGVPLTQPLAAHRQRPRPRPRTSGSVPATQPPADCSSYASAPLRVLRTGPPLSARV